MCNLEQTLRAGVLARPERKGSANLFLALIKGEKSAGPKRPGCSQMPQIERGMARGVAIHNHSRSSMMICARLVRVGFPGLGMSCNNWSRLEDALFPHVHPLKVENLAALLLDDNGLAGH